MAKIIEHNFTGSTGRSDVDLLTRSFGCYMQELEERKLILGEMVMQARLFLEQEGMDPGAFVLSGTYMREFLFTDLNEEEERWGYGELVYLNCRDDRITAVCQFAVPEGEGITISYQIYSLDQASGNARRWKLYNFLSGSWIEDDEDCFDPLQVRDEYERFLREKRD